MPQSFTCLHYHLIFSTKQRAPLITADLQPRLYDYIGGIIRGQDGCLLAAGGMPDHIHLLARLSKEVSVSGALRVIKTNSSKWVHETFPDHHAFAWQTGYAAFCVSYSGLESVKHYIASQAEHHRTVSFQDELRTFLRRHQMEFDERYLWT
ncbi:MAG TPA: IS200/IS605 family transposase [Gemmataceae bacterium]|nr:IS200/IS605 family transposase [Gemmataceae bacterium]